MTDIAFWNKVLKTNGCWIYQGALDKAGYGRYTLWGHKTQLAHRYTWVLTRGEIPAGLFICHKCDNPSCVNPAHLFLGTQKDNVHDMLRKGRNKPGSYSTKLNIPQVKKIKHDLLTMAPRYVAAKYNVPREVIYAIKGGRTWSYVEINS